MDYNNNLDLYNNKENKIINNTNKNIYDNGRDMDIFYRKKTNRNKNDFLKGKGTNFTNKNLHYSHNIISNNINNNSKINILNKNNINDFIEYDNPNNNKEELFKKYDTINNKEQQYNIINNKNNINNDIIEFDDNDNYNDNENIDSIINKSNNKIFRSKVLNNNNEYKYNKNNSIDKYKDEINKLKKEIENLENSNEILSSQSKEEEKRNEELNIIKNEKEESDNSILLDICNCLQVNSFDDILPKLTEMINYLNKYNNDENSKIKEDLIMKLKSLYIATTDSKENKDDISIQDLWRWIKHLINNVKQLSVEKEKNEEIYKKNNYEIYKKYCEKLIDEFGLNSFDELKFFINDLLTKNNINKKRVEKLRKVLMNNNEKEEYSSTSGYFNNDENYNENENEYEMNMNEKERINGKNNTSNKKFNFKYH